MSVDPKDVDLMRDVYMSFNQRAAFNRILERALSQPVGAGEGFVVYLAQGRRFKLAQSRNGASFDGFPAELAGKWVALVDATDGLHLAAPTPPAAAQEDGRDGARYRWLCERRPTAFQRFVIGTVAPGPVFRKDLIDTAIDAAMLTSPDSGKEGAK